jgi:hypothetical protein
MLDYLICNKNFSFFARVSVNLEFECHHTRISIQRNFERTLGGRGILERESHPYKGLGIGVRTNAGIGKRNKHEVFVQNKGMKKEKIVKYNSWIINFFSFKIFTFFTIFFF